jgi:hypothetical protein
VAIQALYDHVYREAAKATRDDQNPNIIDGGHEYDRNFSVAVVR